MASGPGGQSGFGGMQHHHGPFVGSNVQSGKASISLGGSPINQPQRKAFTGKVTKLLDNFGFVDNDVFFQLSVVRGEQKPRVGDTVYVECQYGEHMPFKWNATCVQVLDGSSAIPPSTAASIVSSSNVSPTNTSSSVKALVSTYFSSSHGNSDLRQDPRVGSSTGSGVGYGFGPGNQSVSSNDHEREAMAIGNASAGGPFASRNPSFHSEYQLNEANGHRVGFQTPGAVSGAAFGSQPASYSSRGAPNQITYTSTPGSAFVQPFIDPMLLQQSAVGGPVIPPASGTSREGPFGQTPVSQGSPQPRASRWEPKGTSSKEEPRALEASKADDRKRNHSAERDRAARPGKDRYGRDLPERNEREKNRNDRGRNRSTESPSPLAPHSDNVPKHKLFRNNLSAQDIRRFYGMKVRVPSDFEVLLVNNHLSLDVNAIPKPIKYKFHDVKKDKKREEKDSRDSKEKRKESEAPESEQKDINQERSQNAAEEVPENSAGGQNDITMSIEKEEQEETKPIPKEEVNDIKEGGKQKAHRKFSAKVILLSLPSMKELFEKVLGYDFERQTYTSYTAYLSRVITFLSCKNSNSGYSLIGGRFVEESDGFLPESDQPNLINTAVRCVREQTGLDLSSCSKWISIGTFVYNRNDTLGNAAVYEYTTVFLPDVWSLFEAENKTPNQIKTEEIKTEELKIEKAEEKETSNVIGKDDTVLDSLSIEDEQKDPTEEEVSASLPSDANNELLSRINDLKVADLKNELSTRGVEFARNAKKADLVVLLKESLSATPSSQHSQEQVPVPSQTAIETEGSVAPKEQVEEDIQKLPCLKRPVSDDHQSDTPPKKTKTSESLKKVKISGSTIELLEYIPLTTTTLYQALMHHKNDHFELSVTAELLREAIIRHLACFIASCLQANSSNIKAAEKSANEARKKPPTLVHLYFSFFDERHMGYVWAEDILELLNCVGFRFSRKTWSALTSDLDKLYYRTLEPPTATISYTLPKHPLESSSQSERCSSIFTKNGVVYDIGNLIEQSEQYSKSQVVVKDLQSVIVEKAKLSADYEMKQKKMASAIDKQNDEICDLKREREEQKKKNEDLKKLLEGALSTLTQGLKIVKDKEPHEKDKEKSSN